MSRNIKLVALFIQCAQKQTSGGYKRKLIMIYGIGVPA